MPGNVDSLFRALTSGAIGLTVFLGSGCTSFNHEWKQAGAAPVNADLQGRWQGTWASDVNGHNDSLRCVITKKEAAIYRARFHAKYQKVFSFGYTALLKAEPTIEGCHFRGEADLGWWAGGVYHYEGHADSTNFYSTYSCKYDHGTFTMSRVLNF